MNGRDDQIEQGESTVPEPAPTAPLVEGGSASTSLEPGTWRAWLHVAGSSASLFAVIIAFAGEQWLGGQIWPILVVAWVLGYSTYLTRRTERVQTEYRRERGRLEESFVKRIGEIESEYSTRARYAMIGHALHGVQHTIRDAQWSLMEQQKTPEAALDDVRDALREVARVFTVTTGAPCRASIKAIAAPEEAKTNDDLAKLEVKTLCRDSYTSHAAYDEEAYPLNESTTFEALVDNNNRYRWWYSNDILELEEDPAVRYRNKSIKSGESAKNLPYRSTAVWPIRKVTAAPDRVDEVRGFLCIDSPEPDIFNTSYHFELGASFADSFYTVIRMMFEVTVPTPKATEAIDLTERDRDTQTRQE